MELTSDRKGAIAEAAIAAAAIRAGICVARPMTQERYDLLFDLGCRIDRVQCKWATLKGSVVAVTFLTSRRTASGYRRTRYTSSEVDAIAAYCLDLDRCFYLPIAEFEGRAFAHLRLVPAQNSQIKAINWADSYDLGATLSTFPGP